MLFNDNQKTVLDLANRVAARDLAPKARQVDEAHMFPRDGMRALAEAGFLGLTVPDTLGGEGRDTLSFVLVAEAIAKACASTALVFVTHATVTKGLAIAGSNDQKKRLLPDLISGKKLAALASTEANSGSNTFAITTKLRVMVMISLSTEAKCILPRPMKPMCIWYSYVQISQKLPLTFQP